MRDLQPDELPVGRDGGGGGEQPRIGLGIRAEEFELQRRVSAARRQALSSFFQSAALSAFWASAGL